MLTTAIRWSSLQSSEHGNTGNTDMAYFKQIDAANTRRFRVTDGDFSGSLVAIYDQCRSWTKYAFVGDEFGTPIFVGEPHCYFADQVEEIH